MAAPADAHAGPGDGQGIAHVQYTFSAHRAVVVVDTKPGRVKVVALDTARDVGRALHLQAVIGQTQDEPAHGMELALMEDVIVTDARAIRQATGMALSRLPIRPEHLRGC